jgi:hypothetical protein
VTEGLDSFLEKAQCEPVTRLVPIPDKKPVGYEYGSGVLFVFDLFLNSFVLIRRTGVFNSFRRQCAGLLLPGREVCPSFLSRILTCRLIFFYEVYGGKGHAAWDLVTQTLIEHKNLVCQRTGGRDSEEEVI